jgi:hypothetical protein
MTCAMVDWRTYTTAIRPRWSGVILVLIIAFLHHPTLNTEGHQEKIGQGLDKPLGIWRQRAIDSLVFGIENELRRVAIWTSPHGLSPSSLKDAIVRQVSESRMPPERRQT